MCCVLCAVRNVQQHRVQKREHSAQQHSNRAAQQHSSTGAQQHRSTAAHTLVTFLLPPPPPLLRVLFPTAPACVCKCVVLVDARAVWCLLCVVLCFVMFAVHSLYVCPMCACVCVRPVGVCLVYYVCFLRREHGVLCVLCVLYL